MSFIERCPLVGVSFIRGSTVRGLQVCHVGRRRWYAVHEEKEVELKRKMFLLERCQQQHGGHQRDRGEGGEGDGEKMSKSKLQCEEIEGVSSGGEGQGELVETGRAGCGVTEYGSVLVSRKEGGGMTSRERVGIQSHSNECNEATCTTPHGCGRGSGPWSVSFVPRSSTEQTRNCARVDRDLQQFIVQTLAGVLLETEQWITITNSAPTTPPATPPTEPSHVTCSIGKTGCSGVTDIIAFFKIFVVNP